TLDLKDQSWSNIFALLIAADELLLDRLVDYVQKYLIENGSTWLEENFTMVMSTVFKIQSFKKIQSYITTKLAPPVNSYLDILEILNIADKLALDNLIERIKQSFIRNEPSWFKEKFVDFLSEVTNLKRCEKIQDSIIKIIKDQQISWLKENIFVYLWDIKNFNKFKKIRDCIVETVCIDPDPLLFELENFPTLEKDIFLEFIKREDLIIEEIDLWNYLVKWGTAQFISLSEEKPVNADVTSWGENEFLLFKTKIEPFINYIRFCEISRVEFYYHILPFEKALPEDLYKELVAYFIADIKPQLVCLQPRVEMTSIDSVIINKKNARTIVKWIKGITAFNKQPSYEFIFCYRATHNGFNFKELNDKLYIRSRVMLIKIKDSDRIIDPNDDGFVLIFGSGIDSNCKIPCRVMFNSSYGSLPSIDFDFGRHLKLKRGYEPKNNILINFDDTNITAEEIEIFEIKINN
ncbi:27734_t:CDS:2, partial [Racocetra persica]